MVSKGQVTKRTTVKWSFGILSLKPLPVFNDTLAQAVFRLALEQMQETGYMLIFYTLYMARYMEVQTKTIYFIEVCVGGIFF